MTTPITLEFKERNAVLSGLVSDEVAIFFMSCLFDEKEKALYANGHFAEATNLLAKRREEALKLQSEDEYAGVMSTKFFYEYSHNTETRINIITRLTEIFDFPAEMVSRRNDGSYKICLEMREIAEIVFGIVGSITIKEETKKQASDGRENLHLPSEYKEKPELKHPPSDYKESTMDEIQRIEREEKEKLIKEATFNKAGKIALLEKEIEALKNANLNQ